MQRRSNAAGRAPLADKSHEVWPVSAAARDRFVLAQRGSRPRHNPWRYQDLSVEDELSGDGTVRRSGTVFLTGRECPWRCLMCDLWRHTTPTDTPVGAIPEQIRAAREVIGMEHGSVFQIKLYNAANFFDPRAVPEEDYDAIAAGLDGIGRVVVECHPTLIGDRVDRFLDALERRPPAPAPATARLEVAMGLETAHPDALQRLNKRMTPRTFERGSRRLQNRGIAVRVFLLIAPPFVPPHEQAAWLLRSVETAFRWGASVVSLVPTRAGNGALDTVAARGQFAEPDLSAIERSINDALRFRMNGRRVFVDLWDLDRFARCRHCLDARRARLHAINLGQRSLPSVACEQCGETTP